MVFGVDQPVLHVENGLLEIFRLVCGSRRRRLRAAGVSGAGRRAGRLLRAAWLSGREHDFSASQLACT